MRRRPWKTSVLGLCTLQPYVPLRFPRSESIRRAEGKVPPPPAGRGGRGLTLVGPTGRTVRNIGIVKKSNNGYNIRIMCEGRYRNEGIGNRCQRTARL